jgi:arylsulfatase A-like enzyme
MVGSRLFFLTPPSSLILTLLSGAWIDPSSGFWGAQGNPLFGGSNAPFKGGKGSTWEGGVREPAIIWAPGRLSPGVTTMEVTSMMDFFPTFMDLANIEVSFFHSSEHYFWCNLMFLVH